MFDLWDAYYSLVRNVLRKDLKIIFVYNIFIMVELLLVIMLKMQWNWRFSLQSCTITTPKSECISSSSGKLVYTRACVQPVRMLFVHHIYNCIVFFFWSILICT